MTQTVMASLGTQGSRANGVCFSIFFDAWVCDGCGDSLLLLFGFGSDLLCLMMTAEQRLVVTVPLMHWTVFNPNPFYFDRVNCTHR